MIETARRLGSLLAFSLALVASAAAEIRPARVVSINMCTDQLLIDLAEPGQIAGLSPYARDATRSWFAQQARTLPVLSGTAEEIVLIRPDLVLSGRFSRRATQAFIKERRIRVAEFDPARTLAEARDQIIRMGELLGASDKARQRAEQLDAALDRLKNAAARSPIRILPLSRRGWIAGRDSLLSDILASGGLTNAAGAGLAEGGFLPLERIVLLQPDALVLTRDDDVAEDQGRAMVLHPALLHLFPPERRIVLPEYLTVCSGPMLAEAMDRLARQIGGLTPRRVERSNGAPAGKF